MCMCTFVMCIIKATYLLTYFLRSHADKQTAGDAHAVSMLHLEMGKTQNFVFGSLGFFDDKGSVLFFPGSEYFKKIKFVFGSRAVNVGLSSGSSSIELERCFPGPLRINCM